jgi:diguanylate cyclase (GGDEF)-like protein
MKVLVVDDDVVSRLMLQGTIEALGHECLVADNGEQGWDLFVHTDPDVVITDWVMPGMNGIDLCRRIRAEFDRPYTYIVVATSLVERDEVLEGMAAGADDYLTKPLEPFDLEVRLVAAERVTSLHAELGRYRADLARLASTDPLTQLHNRLSLAEALDSLHARSERYGRGYCLAMCDVDLFKAYNDVAGHQAGDDVLRRVGATLAGLAREADSVFRYGGEEFLLLLPEQSMRSAAVVGERIRRAVEDLGVEHPTAASGVLTISVGVAAFAPGDAASSTDVLKAADVALYEAKDAGRNRVALAG